MKKLLFKILIKFFRKQIEDMYIERQLPQYKVDLKNSDAMEKLAELYTLPEFKLYMRIQGNKKNFLGKKALVLKYSNEKQAAYGLSFLKGQAYEIQNSLQFVKHINRLYQKKRSKEEKLGENND